MNASIKGIPWRIIFPFGLWLHGNNFIFTIGTVDNQCWKKCLRYSTKFFAVGLEARSKPVKSIIPVGWEKPPWGWLKLNSDGSALNNPGKVGGGGLLRDHEGNWVKGYVRGIGYTNSFMAELWALRDGFEYS